MNTVQKIGLVIKKQRNLKGLSQDEFSEFCEIDKHYLSDLENGKRNVGIEIIEKISIKLGLSLSQFFKLVEELTDTQPIAPRRIRTVSSKGFYQYIIDEGRKPSSAYKYSNTVPNNLEVQNVIRSVTGTFNLYCVTSESCLNRIVEILSNKTFDIVGQRMYSCGIKKYIQYLGNIGCLDE